MARKSTTPPPWETNSPTDTGNAFSDLPWDEDNTRLPEWLTGEPPVEPPAPTSEGVILTAEQQAFMSAAMNWDILPVRIIGLSGEAGSGKTFTLAQLAKRVPDIVDEDGDPHPGILFLSPTHQAKNVLLAELSDAGVPAPNVLTVAGFLGKRPDKNSPPNKDGRADFLYSDDAKTVARGGYYIVVDEVSMVDTEDIRRITTINADGLTILSGDPAQLPPVEGRPVWASLDIVVEMGQALRYHLTQNMRARSPELARWINEIRANGGRSLPDWTPPEVRLYYSRDSFNTALADATLEDPEQTVVLAWRNIVVQDLARFVRDARGYTPQWPCTGELLRVDAPLPLTNWRDEYDLLRSQGYSHDEARVKANDIVRETQLQVGDIVEVLEVRPPRAWQPVPASLPCFVAKCRIKVLSGDYAGRERYVDVAELGNKEPMLATMATIAAAIKGDKSINPAGVEWLADPRNTTTKNGKGMSLWHKFYYENMESVLRASNASCMTVHKSQGSGRDTVFVLWPDLAGPEAESLRYVAVSRARRELHIFVGSR